jgi:hypothetical protein
MKHTIRCLVVATVVGAPLPAHATSYPLTAADRIEISALARAFFEATRDTTRDPQGVFPTAAELRTLMPAPRGAVPDGGLTLADEVAVRQFRAIERDVAALRTRFTGGVFVGIASYRGNRVDLHPCGRFARATSQCGDGPVIEYSVGGETRRFRIDTLVRLRGHWRIFDVRP